MPLLLIALLAAGGYAVYEKKKNPNWNPLASITGQKSAALSKVAQTSTPTPASTAGLDPNMTSAQVAAANSLLAAGSDSAAMYSLASDYSNAGFVNTAKALIAKADAVSQAKTAGAADSGSSFESKRRVPWTSVLASARATFPASWSPSL